MVTLSANLSQVSFLCRS